MRYRKLTATGDMTFGQGANNFYVNQAEAVAQAAVTRLRLLQIQDVGEWFLDTSDGTPWDTQVLGYGTQRTRDIIIQDRVNGTPGLTEILNYQSGLNHFTRVFGVAMTIDTIYGTVNVGVNANGQFGIGS